MLNLRQEVELLARPEGRVVGTLGHETARRHLEHRLSTLKLEPYRGDTFALPYRTSGHDFCNLVAVAPGQRRDLAPVLIGAHYDSVIEGPCADDNAAAVALALAAGEHFQSQPAERDVVIALFDAEEPPFIRSPAMGSIRFYEDQRHPIGFHAALIMDLVGHALPSISGALDAVLPTFGQLLIVSGAESHPNLPDAVRECRVNGLPVIPTISSRIGDMSDYYSFRVHGDPYLFLTCGRWEHYHQMSDTPDRLDYEKMGRIRDYLINLTGKLAGATLLPIGERPGREVDTTAFEIALIRDALGAQGMAALGAVVGLARLETRADLDLLALRLQSYFEL